MAFKAKNLHDHDLGSYGQHGQAVPTNSDKDFRVIGGFDSSGTQFNALQVDSSGKLPAPSPSESGLDTFGVVYESADVTAGTEPIVGSADGSAMYITDISVSVQSPINYWFTGSGTVISTKYVPGSSVWSKHYEPPLSIGEDADFIMDANATANVSVDVQGYYE